MTAYHDELAWLQEHWTPRELPLRLHERDFGDDGAPRLTTRFLRYLTARPSDSEETTEQRLCAHLRNASQNRWECPDCAGTGVYETAVNRYRYPMWRALVKLAGYDRANPPRPGNPHMLHVVVALAAYRFDGRKAADALFRSTERGRWELGEPYIVMAIRRLKARYEHSPTGLGWTQKSDSQRNAEGVAA